MATYMCKWVPRAIQAGKHPNGSNIIIRYNDTDFLILFVSFSFEQFAQDPIKKIKRNMCLSRKQESACDDEEENWTGTCLSWNATSIPDARMSVSIFCNGQPHSARDIRHWAVLLGMRIGSDGRGASNPLSPVTSLMMHLAERLIELAHTAETQC